MKARICPSTRAIRSRQACVAARAETSRSRQLRHQLRNRKLVQHQTPAARTRAAELRHIVEQSFRLSMGRFSLRLTAGHSRRKWSQRSESAIFRRDCKVNLPEFTG